MKKYYIKNLENHIVNEDGIALEEFIIFGEDSVKWNKRGFYVDHRNGNTLDCRRFNLVIVDLEGIKARDNNDIEGIKNRVEFNSLDELKKSLKQHKK